MQYVNLAFFIALIALTITTIIGLISPAKVIKKDPKRWKVLIGYFSLSFVLLIVIGAINQPGTPTTTEPPQTVSAPPPQAQKKRGIGVSRAMMNKYFSKAGYDMTIAEPASAGERWFGMGKDGFAEIIGPADDLAEIAVTYNLLGSDKDTQSKDILEISGLMAMFFPNWPERGKWLTETFKAVGGSTTRDGKVVLITPAPIGVSFSIRADWAEDRFSP